MSHRDLSLARSLWNKTKQRKMKWKCFLRLGYRSNVFANSVINTRFCKTLAEGNLFSIGFWCVESVNMVMHSENFNIIS